MNSITKQSLTTFGASVVVVLLAGTEPAQASWSAGVGTALGQSPYQGVDSNPNTIPAFINYRSRFAYIRGLEAGVNFWGSGDAKGSLETSLLVSARLAGYSSSDSEFLDGMDKRGWSLDGGVGLSGRMNAHQFSVKGVHDLLNKHQGYELSGSYRYGLQMSDKLTVSPGVAVYWQSSDLVNYYYGVTESEARDEAGRPAYRAGSGWKPSVSLNLMYAFRPKMSVMVAGRTRKLPSSVVDSPLVNREYVSGVLVALMYRF